VPARQSPLHRLALVALVVAAADLASKELAVALLAGRDVPLLGAWHLRLLHNTASAGGVWLGDQTWIINAVATLAALLLAVGFCRHIARVDSGAPFALGLIAGAAAGNLASLVIPPAGVPDFLAFRVDRGHDVVFNVADVAAYVGIVLGLRTVATLVAAARAPRPAPVSAKAAAVATVWAPRRAAAEVVVPIPLAVERGRGSSGEGARRPVPGDGGPERRAAREAARTRPAPRRSELEARG
jgi:lipoprotein signal peptidase